MGSRSVAKLCLATSCLWFLDRRIEVVTERVAEYHSIRKMQRAVCQMTQKMRWTATLILLLAGIAITSTTARAGDKSQASLPEWVVKGPTGANGPWSFHMLGNGTAGCSLVSEPEPGTTITITDVAGMATMALVIAGHDYAGEQGALVDMDWSGRRQSLPLSGRMVGEAMGAQISPESDPDRLSLRLIQETTVLAVSLPGKPKRRIGLAAANPQVLDIFVLCMKDKSRIPAGFTFGAGDAKRQIKDSR